VAILSSSGLYTIYAYRSLVKDLSWRAEEFPRAARLGERVIDLRMCLSELNGLRSAAFPLESSRLPVRVRVVHQEFGAHLEKVEQALCDYRDQLEHKLRAGSPVADDQREWAAVDRLEDALGRIREKNRRPDWVLNDVRIEELGRELDHLQTLTAELPSYLHDKMSGLAVDVRSQYRALIAGIWIASAAAAMVFALCVHLFTKWVFRPLGVLIAGSRKVASGQFGHRIRLETRDEMAELAEAMNQMTARFQAIRDDLDRQVQERTKQVVRNEQLASVGFLAAGVAHEINNPLTSIAMAAESLDDRLRGTLDPENPDHAVVFRYLQMIQSEAFRCKGITERLLDFARIGPSCRQETDLVELVQGVIEMLGHLDKYHRRRIELDVRGPVVAPVNPQEIKQVVLNLLTNALDSVSDGGVVRVTVGRKDGWAELAVIDDGCGMTPEVIERVFEPFFTRRREGQGTGLGLSISYRIVSDHGGAITAESEGPGRGAAFRVCLPLAEKKEAEHRYRAA
jgi:signal transduction histidine kinase